MAYTFRAEGWEGWNYERHEGQPSRPETPHGVFVHVYDPDNPEDQTYFWAYALNRFHDWAEWWTYIGGLMIHNYGLDLAEA